LLLGKVAYILAKSALINGADLLTENQTAPQTVMIADKVVGGEKILGCGSDGGDNGGGGMGIAYIILNDKDRAVTALLASLGCSQISEINLTSLDFDVKHWYVLSFVLSVYIISYFCGFFNRQTVNHL
jgi:hypothetical protein